MLLYLIILLFALPFLDLYILIETAGILGILPTVALILLTGIAGAAILKREIDQVGRKLFTSVTAQEISRNILEGLILGIGGLMLLSPGFITDFLGLLMAIRPTRVRLTLKIEEKLKESSNIQVEVERY